MPVYLFFMHNDFVLYKTTRNSFLWFALFERIKSLKRAIMSVSIILTLMQYPSSLQLITSTWLLCLSISTSLELLILPLFKKNNAFCFRTGCCIIVCARSHTQLLSACLSASSQPLDSPAVMLTSVQNSKHYDWQCVQWAFNKYFNYIETKCFYW